MGKVRDFAVRIISILRSPKKFFPSVAGEDWKAAYFYYLALSLFSSVMAYFFIPELQSGPFMAVVVFALSALSIFMMSAIFQLFVQLLGGAKGRAGYFQTLKAFAYGFTPSALLGWIPFIGVVFYFWTLYIEIVAIASLHKMTKRKAALVVALTVVVIIVIAAVAGAITAWNILYSANQ